MGLGQGIQQGTQLWAKLLMDKQDREDQLFKEAQARALQSRNLDIEQQQLDYNKANQDYDNAFQALQYAPDNTIMAREEADRLPPMLRSMYTKDQMELPSRPIGMGRALEGPKPTGQVTTVSPFRSALEVAKVRAGSQQAISTANNASRERIASLRQQMSPYQQALVQAAKDRTGLGWATLKEAEQYHDEMLANRTDLNLQDAQSAWDIAYARALARNKNFQMPTPRPTAPPKGKEGATAPPPINFGAFNF